jgi:transcriptional regulator of acetoin/glycerol metabolism
MASDHSSADTAREEIILELTGPSLPKAEAYMIHKVLEERGWNVKQAANDLEIARSTLYSKMKKYNIKRPSARLKCR